MEMPYSMVLRGRIELLQKVQNMVARIILNKHPRDSATQCLKLLHCLSIQYKNDYKVAMLVFTSIHDMAPKHLTDLLTERKIWDYALPTEINYSTYEGQQEKYLPQEPSLFMGQPYGTNYQTILGPQQTTVHSKENLKHTYSK